MIHKKLQAFKHLLKDSKHFLKSNWKKILYLFLPIQIIIFVVAIVLDLIPSDTESNYLVVLSLISVFVSFIGAAFLKMISVGAPLFLKSIEDTETNSKNIHWYKVILKKIIPIAWIGILVSLVNISFVTFVGFVSLIIFILPSVFVGILLRFGFTDFAFSFQDLFVNNTTVGTMLAVLFVGVIVSSIAFFINSYFSVYSFLMEGRKGLDALTTSFLSVSKRRAKIFWRVVGIWVISLIPFIILVFPIQAKIMYDALKSMAIEVFLLQIEPAWPEAPANILVIKDILYFVASIISLPIFVVLNYLLWKDVHATTVSFEENKYNKTRKWIKIGVWSGVLILVIFITFSIIAALSFGTQL
jgi:hypothetical protein